MIYVRPEFVKETIKKEILNNQDVMIFGTGTQLYELIPFLERLNKSFFNLESVKPVIEFSKNTYVFFIRKENDYITYTNILSFENFDDIKYDDFVRININDIFFKKNISV